MSNIIEEFQLQDDFNEISDELENLESCNELVKELCSGDFKVCDIENYEKLDENIKDSLDTIDSTLDEIYSKVESINDEMMREFDSFLELASQLFDYGDSHQIKKFVELIAFSKKIDDLPTDIHKVSH